MSRIMKIECPNCGANIDVPKNGQRIVFCPYCATSLDYDDTDLRLTIDESVEKVTHKIDYAKLAEIEYKERKEKRDNKIILLGILALLLPGTIIGTWPYITRFLRDTADKSKVTALSEQGFICPGKSAEDFEGEKADSVVKQLESVGFTNIEKVAVGGGIAIWSWGDVKEVMIDGQNDFGAYAYFPPNAPIVVTYK